MKRKNLNKLWKQWISAILVLVMITLAPISSMAEVGYEIPELTKREYQDLIYGDVGTSSDVNREEPVSEEEEDWSDGLEGGTPSDAVPGTPSDAERLPRESGEYQVTFYVDGKVWDTQFVTRGESAYEPSNPEKEGHTFIGWSGQYRAVTSSRSIMAQFIQGEYETHRVEFLDHEEAPIGNPQYVIDGRDAACPSVPLKVGHTFFGWDMPTYRIHEDKVFRPTYREGTYKTYQVSYHGYSSEVPGKEILLKREWVAEGEDSVPPVLEERSDHTFARWDRGEYRNIRSNRWIYAVYHYGKVETHKVEFLNADSIPIGNPRYVIDGSDVVSPSSPLKLGHTFFGWDMPTYRIHEDKVFRPTYREGAYKTYGVSYYGYSSEAPGREILLKLEYVAEGEDGVPPELEERAGYTFAGWGYAQYRNVRKHQTLHAAYHLGKVEMHKVEFLNAEGVPIGNPQYVIDGGDAVWPSNPVKTGYTFFGWDMPTYRIHEDKVFRPTYREGIYKTYAVGYYGYSSEAPGREILLKLEYVAEGEDGVPPELEERAGYTFAGWGYAQYRNVRKHQTLHAVYHLGKVETHKVEFLNAEGVPIGNPQYVIDGSDAFCSYDPVKTGYTFFGWDTSTYRIHDDKVFRPIYREGNYKVHKVYYRGYSSELPGVKIVLKVEWVAEGEDSVPPQLEERPGYTFAGWGGGTYRNVRDYQIIEAGYLSGKVETHKVEFVNAAGVPIGNPQYVMDGRDAVRRYNNPVKEGYTFFGWDTPTYRIHEDKVFRPIFREGNYKVYQVFYRGYSSELPGKEIILKEEWVAEGEDSVPPVLEERSGYTFARWDRGEYRNVRSNRAINAVYYPGKVETHKVEFLNSDGEPIGNPQYVIDGRDALRPGDPLKAGYTFFGWNEPTYRIHREITFRPTYRKGNYKTYRVYYHGYSSELPGSMILLKEEWVAEGEDGEPPVLEEWNGYTFSKWGNGEYRDVRKNQVLHAEYHDGNVKTYKVEFLDGEGTPIGNPQYVIDGKDPSRPSNPQKAGYTFFGWDALTYRIHRDTVFRPIYREGLHTAYRVSYYGRSKEVPGKSIILKDEWVAEGEDSEPPVPETLKDCTFAGWEKTSLYTNIRSSRMIQATYHDGKGKTHRVEYVDHEGKPIYNPQYVMDGRDAVRPSDPPRVGYTFFGWDTPSYRIQKDTAICPIYREGNYNVYKVCYYGRSSEFPAENVLLKEEWVVAGEDSVPPELETVRGVTFAGWERGVLYTNIKSGRTIQATYHDGKGETYKVEYVDPEGKAICNPQYVIAGRDAVRPSPPKKPDIRSSGGIPHTIGFKKTRSSIPPIGKAFIKHIKCIIMAGAMNFQGAIFC